jgi:hypothetical protein
MDEYKNRIEKDGSEEAKLILAKYFLLLFKKVAVSH